MNNDDNPTKHLFLDCAVIKSLSGFLLMTFFCRNKCDFYSKVILS